ncbi:hypothetical protein [Nitrobacter sp.]|uniref:hypothetical protein n=1 Tax=Nitrobacter sp. TaxID=29420 RepID=UPI0029CAB1AE|nr:hypothetical protein [Nitrobacter sp.]
MATRAERERFEVPAHLDKAEPEPSVDVNQIRTKGDLKELVGVMTIWGRTVAAQYAELRRLIDVFDGQAHPPTTTYGGPK